MSRITSLLISGLLIGTNAFKTFNPPPPECITGEHPAPEKIKDLTKLLDEHPHDSKLLKEVEKHIPKEFTCSWGGKSGYFDLLTVNMPHIDAEPLYFLPVSGAPTHALMKSQGTYCDWPQKVYDKRPKGCNLNSPPENLKLLEEMEKLKIGILYKFKETTVHAGPYKNRATLLAETLKQKKCLTVKDEREITKNDPKPPKRSYIKCSKSETFDFNTDAIAAKYGEDIDIEIEFFNEPGWLDAK